MGVGGIALPDSYRSTSSIRTYYDSIAPRYDRWIAPAVTPLIANLIGSIPVPITGLRVLDIGSGTGITAKMLVANHSAQAIGIDVSAAMLLVGGQYNPVQADLRQPPFGTQTFDLVISSFGLNNAEPVLALKQIWRLLRPGGWVVGQEWAAQDEIAAAFDQATADIKLSGSDPHVDLPDQWSDQMQDADDYRDRLAKAGFTAISAEESIPVSIRLSLRTFAGYRLAWLTEPAQYVDLIAARLESLADQDNLINWQPPLFRFTAQRPV